MVSVGSLGFGWGKGGFVAAVLHGFAERGLVAGGVYV